MVKITQKMRKGFTLIELMIVVAIIGILAAVAIPKFADLVTKSKEASAKGTLGAVRSAVSIYYSDTEGIFPSNLFLGLTLANKYLPSVGGTPSLGRLELPRNNMGNPGHAQANMSATTFVVQVASFTTGINDAGYLLYGTGSGFLGDVAINCSHNDSKGNQWTTY